MTKIEELLNLFEQKTHDLSGFERGLYFLLKEFESNLPEIDDYFHKAFRQIDVTNSGKIDMAIWNALQESNIFWECFAIVTSKDNKDDENESC